MSFANPFNEIFENAEYPHARTWRTDFAQKMQDTFFVFAGSFFSRRRNHLGLFDYMTLGIPYGIAMLAFGCFSIPTKSPFEIPGIIVGILLGILSLALAAVRYTLAAVFALVVSPAVILTQFISKLFGSDTTKTKIDSIQVKINLNSRDSETITLGEFLKQKKINLEKIKLDCVGNYNKLRLEFNQRFNAGPSGAFICEGCMRGGDHDHRADASTEIDLHNPNDQSTLRALLELNVGNISRKLEKRRVNFSLFRSVDTVRASAEFLADNPQAINTRARRQN